MRKSLKIVMIGCKGIPCKSGGIERHVEELSKRLAKLGERVFVYCRPWYTKTNHKLQITNYKPKLKRIILPSIKTKHLDTISHVVLATLHAMTFVKPNIYHFHGVGPALVAWIPQLFSKGKVIVTFHCIDRKHQKWGMFARIMLRVGEWCAVKFSDETICVSKTLQLYASEAYDTETIYIPNGVTSGKQRGVNSKLLNKFGLEKNKYIVMVARLVRHKGAHYLIDAFKRINPNGFKLAIVGGAAFTDDYVKELKSKVKGNKNIILTGSQSGRALETLYRGAYLLVHPSETEGLPITVLEAMNYGKTALVSDIPENKEVVGRNYGFTFRNRQVKDLARKLKFLLASPEIVENCGLRAQKYAAQNYNWDEIAKTTHKLYHQVLEVKETELAPVFQERAI